MNQALPLEGIRVIDLSNVVMGPYATQILAQYGADVIKIEPPGGDDARRTGACEEENMASLFLGVNRGKRSVIVDLKSSEAKAQLGLLIRSGDVLVHNIRPQKLRSLGIDVESVMRINPRIVYVSLTGFGQVGPYGGRPAYDDVIQGMSGLADLSGRHHGGEPGYMPTIAADKTVGLLAASAILAGLMKQQREGEGSVVEVPMFESMVAYSLVEHMHGAHFHAGDGPMGYPRALARWRKPFATLDGYVCVMPYTDRHWHKLLHRLGSPGLASDSRFGSIGQRSEHSDFVYETLGSLLAVRTTAEVLDVLAEIEVPATPVLRPEDLRHDPHLKEVGFFQHVADAEMGQMCFPGVPVLFDGRRPELGLPPRLGQHTLELLGETQGTAAF